MQIISNSQGQCLFFSDLKSSADAVAMIFSQHDGTFALHALTALNTSEGHVALAERLAMSAMKGSLSLFGLTELSDIAAEKLGGHVGEINLGGLSELSESAAKGLSSQKGILNLSGISSISEGAAKELSGHLGPLDLYGLETISDEAACHLAKREVHRSSDSNYGAPLHFEHLLKVAFDNISKSAASILKAKTLTKEDALSFVENSGRVDIEAFTAIDDAAAEILSKYGGKLNLESLTDLSDAAAASLSKHQGTADDNDWSDDFSLPSIIALRESEGYTSLARKLSSTCYRLRLNELTELSDSAAEAFSKHEGTLWLMGLTTLSDESARKLSQADTLYVDLDNLPSSAVKIIRDAGHKGEYEVG